MTVKKYLYVSNTLMLVIPLALSVFVSFWGMRFYMNVIRREETETARAEQYFLRLRDKIALESAETLSSPEALAEAKLLADDETLNAAALRLKIYCGDEEIHSEGSFKASDQRLIAAALLAETGFLRTHGTEAFIRSLGAGGKNYSIVLLNDPIFKRRFESPAQRTIPPLLLLAASITVAVFITNRVLTRLVFLRIMNPLNELRRGVTHIRGGDLDWRISCQYDDEFKSVCADFNEMARRLKDSVDADQKNERARKELIAGISHDLRTPLTSIIAYVEGLLDGVVKTEEAKRDYMNTILSKARDIDQMIDKLFLFSKLDMGDFPLYPEKINAAEDLRRYIQENKAYYEERGLIIEIVSIPQSAFCVIDPLQFHTALSNIFDNSANYKIKPTGLARVFARTNEDFFEIILDDDGPGVSDEALDKLFNVFYRSDPSRHNPRAGSGLGLAITRRIVEQMGGSILALNVRGRIEDAGSETTGADDKSANVSGLRVILKLPAAREDGGDG